MRHDQRLPDELRQISVQKNFPSAAPGSVLIQAGGTIVLCTASLERGVPPWKLRGLAEGEEPTGWVTAEYNMLPGSTSPRKIRDRQKVDGRTTEIQRLIGRSLRAVIDFRKLGPNTIVVDCDVIQADGGTRTLSITGGFLALAEAVSTLELAASPFTDSVAAISVGIVDGNPVLDLDYIEDSSADVDMNVVMTGSGNFIEVQGTAEGSAFGRDLLDAQLDLAEQGIQKLTQLQRETLAEKWPLD